MEQESTERVNASCLACSLPLVKFAARVRQGSSGEVFEAVSNTPGFLEDVKLWCRRTGHTLLASHTNDPSGLTVVVRKR